MLLADARAVSRLRAVPRGLLTPGTAMLFLALCLLGVYSALYVRSAAHLIRFPFGWDQGEGYDAWSAWLIAHGQLPYSHNDTWPYFSINYAPVWSALVSVPMAYSGPSLAPARAFSLVATLLDTALIGAAAWRIVRPRASVAAALLAAFIGGALFLSSPYVFHTTPLSRLNSTLTLFNLVALTCFERPTTRRVALGTAFLLLGAYTKPTALFTAVACLGWTVVRRPRLGIITGLAFATLGAACLLALNAITHGAFWLNVVQGNGGPYDVVALVGYLMNLTEIHFIVFGLAVHEIVVAIRKRSWSVWLLACPLALAEGCLVGESGAGESYLLDAIAVSCVFAATAVACLLARWHRTVPDVVLSAPSTVYPAPFAVLARNTPATLGCLLIIQALLMAHGSVARRLPLLRDSGIQGWSLGLSPSLADREAGEEIVGLIQATAGPVLSEEPSFPLVAGKQVVANTTHLRTLDDLGLWDGRNLVADINARRFGIIVLNAQRYPTAVLAAIGRHYYRAREIRMGAATYLVFLPGGEAPRSP